MASFVSSQMDAVRSLVLVANSVSTISKPFDVLNHCFRLVSVLPGCERLVNKRRSLMDIDLFDWMVSTRGKEKRRKGE